MSFIFVINIDSAGGMQSDRVCIHIFTGVIDPPKVLRIINKLTLSHLNMQNGCCKCVYISFWNKNVQRMCIFVYDVTFYSYEYMYLQIMFYIWYSVKC